MDNNKIADAQFESLQTLNLKIYTGEGIPISQRAQKLPDYHALVDDNPAFYVASPELACAVNVALALGQPLLVTGEPGTGKTQLAHSIAYELDLPIWNLIPRRPPRPPICSIATTPCSVFKMRMRRTLEI